MCNWKPKHIWICARVQWKRTPMNLWEMKKKPPRQAKPSQAEHTPSKALNIHTIKIIYQIHILIQFIFCAFRNEAKRKNHCVPLKRWKRKRECFRSIPNCEWRERSWKKKHHRKWNTRFLCIVDKSSAIPSCRFRYDLSLECFKFFFSTIFLRFFL